METPASLCILVLLVSPGVSSSSAKRYSLGEEGVRGTDVIVSLTLPSRITCAGVCGSQATCKGFNWLASERKCESLYSLRGVTSDIYCNLYTQDFPNSKVSVVPLEFGCSTCSGSSPPKGVSTWKHQCLPREGSVAVGVAWREGRHDLDYLICLDYPGMVLDGSDGAVLPDSRICMTLLQLPYVVISVWSDKQYFDQPGKFAYQCRKFISGEQLDGNRCLTPAVTQLYLPGVTGQLFGRQCPPHMVAVNLYWTTASSEALFLCCLVY